MRNIRGRKKVVGNLPQCVIKLCKSRISLKSARFFFLSLPSLKDDQSTPIVHSLITNTYLI